MMMTLTPSRELILNIEKWKMERYLPEFWPLADLSSLQVFLWQTHQDSGSFQILETNKRNKFGGVPMFI